MVHFPVRRVHHSFGTSPLPTLPVFRIAVRYTAIRGVSLPFCGAVKCGKDSHETHLTQGYFPFISLTNYRKKQGFSDKITNIFFLYLWNDIIFCLKIARSNHYPKLTEPIISYRAYLHKNWLYASRSLCHTYHWLHINQKSVRGVIWCLVELVGDHINC